MHGHGLFHFAYRPVHSARRSTQNSVEVASDALARMTRQHAIARYRESGDPEIHSIMDSYAYQPAPQQAIQDKDVFQPIRPQEVTNQVACRTTRSSTPKSNV
jgi:hypothetical protein